MTQVVVEQEETIEEEVEEEEETKTDDKKKKKKKIGTPSFLDLFNIMLDTDYYDPNIHNLRRKHPDLGRKIADLHQRNLKLEHTIRRLKVLLSSVLKKEFKKYSAEMIDNDWSDIISRL